MLCQPLEEKMQVTPVLLGVRAGHENVVDVHKEEILESPTDLVHKSLECLCCVLEAEGHAEELNRPNGVITAVFGTSAAATGI